MLERASTQDECWRSNRLCAEVHIPCVETALFRKSNHTNPFPFRAAAESSTLQAKKSVSPYYERVTVRVKRNLGTECHFFVRLVPTRKERVFYGTEAKKYVELPT
jgi:hypothetical protein